MKMKTKKNLFFIFALVFSLCFFSDTVSAQGLYGNSAESGEQSSGSQGGSLRAGPSTDPGNPTEPGKGDSPIGEGLLVLSVLSGGYAILKKRNTKNQEK
jgi:hypothetical protein